jgi:hypothetical protein
MSNLELASISTYAEAKKFLGNKSERKVGYNTFAQQKARDGQTVIAVRYHDTDIVTYYEDGSIILDSGGWATSTTVNRMHHLTPANVRVNGRYPRRDLPWIEVTVDDGDTVRLNGPMPIVP